MNFIFIPNGLTEVLEEYFDLLPPSTPTAGARGPDALVRGATEGYFLRFLGYARAYLAGARERRIERAAARPHSDLQVSTAP
jgi:hypothetical protein